jgi:hypothetical protein
MAAHAVQAPAVQTPEQHCAPLLHPAPVPLEPAAFDAFAHVPVVPTPLRPPQQPPQHCEFEVQPVEPFALQLTT